MTLNLNSDNNRPFLKIRNKLIILFFVIALLPAVLGYMTLLLYQNSINDQVQASHSAMEESFVKLVDQYVINCHKVIIDAAVQPSVINGVYSWNNSVLQERFSSIFKRYKNFSFVLAVDKNWVVRVFYPQNLSIIGKKLPFSSGPSSSVPSSPAAGLTNDKPGISDVFCSDYIRDPAVVVVFAPVKDKNGRIMGALMGGVDIKTLSSMLDKLKPNKESYIFLTDKKGVVIYHPYERMLLNDLSENNVIVKELIQDKSGIRSSVDENGEKMLTAFKLASLSKWGVVFHDPAKKAYANLVQVKTFFIVITLIGLIVALYFSISFSNRITYPIHELQHGAEMIGAGNLNYRLNIKTGDEIEKLADEFNNMAEKLKESYESLGEKINIAIRDLKDAHGEIEEKNKKLSEADRLKSQFLANMSHELRTPMNAIIGFSSLIEEKIYGEINAKQEDALKKISKNARALLQLINDILDLSKIEAGKISLSFSEFDLNLLIGEIVVMLEPMIKDKSFTFEKIFDKNMKQIYSDRNRLKQVIINLLTNSIKFTKEGKITITAKPVQNTDKVSIAVSDTGIGIKEEDLPSIFEEFRQVDGSYTRKYGGTGLGLSITTKLLDLLDGEIKAESVFNKGTTMTVIIPVRVKNGEKT